MKTAKYDDIQEILRKVFGELYMFKNVSVSYNEQKDTNYFKLEVKISPGEEEKKEPK